MEIPKNDMKVNVSHFAWSAQFPQGTGPVPGRSNTIHGRRDHCLPIDGSSLLPMMELNRIA